MGEPKAELADDASLAERMSVAPTREPRPALLALVAATASLLAFASSIGGSWIYDDHSLVERSVWVHSFAHWRRWLFTDFWDVSDDVRQFTARVIYWRPGVTASYALDWKLGGGSPVVFHATNLLWHALVAVLAFRALHRWLGRALPACVGAALFALHPTKAESVAWIAGRTDVLCAAMMLLVAEAWALRARASSRRAVVGFAALEVLATALAYSMKEQSIVMPAIVAVEAWVALGRPGIGLDVSRKLARAGLPQLVVAVAYLAARRRWLPFGQGDSGVPVVDRVKLVLETFGLYLKSIVWPTGLSIQQGLLHSEHGRYVFHGSYLVAGALFLLAIVVVALWARLRAPAVTLGLAFFLGTVLPTSNLVPTGLHVLVADHFLYLPLLGLAFALVAGVERLAAAPRRVGLLVAGGCAAVLAVSSVARADDFADEPSFWARELKLHPDSLEALRYAIQAASEKHDFRTALALTARGQSVAARLYAHSGDEAYFVFFGARMLASLTPDRDVARLQAVARFCEEAADARSSSAHLNLPDVDLVVPVGRGPAGAQLLRQRPRMIMLRANILSRLGDDATAQGLAAEAQAACPGCAEVGALRASIEARAGNYDRASEVLDALAALNGESSVAEIRESVRKAALLHKQAAMAPEGPIQLNLRAMELAALDAWGRAYAVLVPFKDRIKIAPGMAFGFAELAFRAGYPEVASEILGALVPAEKIAPIERGWSVKMGWSVADPTEAGAAPSP
jgi:hypothetical protein